MFNKNQISDTPFVIAEVGQNHNGDLETAKKYIKVFAQNGADAVKFQTRDNKYLFSKESYDAPYSSENAFAITYGAHREILELKKEWLPILKSECKKYDVKFMSTPFDEPSLDFLMEVGVDILKIASFDLGNLPFINKMAATKVPIVISVGGGNADQIRSSVNTILKHHSNIAILHCVSEYPTPYSRLGLNNIKTLINEFKDFTIGSSDHFNGILSGPVAYLQGARVFEKHVTLNRANKGTDHGFALEPNGFQKFVRDLNRVNKMLTPKPKDSLGSEDVFKKLGKSIVAHENLKKGDELSLDNLSGKIFQNQIIPVRESNKLIGKKVIKDIKAGDPIKFQDIE